MLNKLLLQCRLVKDVELRHTQSGTPVASFTVAWSEKYKDTERQLFMPCVAWRAVAENASRNFHKGREVVVEGYLTTRKWQDKDGNNRETIELNVDRMHFCGAKNDGAAQTGTGYNNGFAGGFTAPAPGGGFGVLDDSEDLPF